MSIYNGTLVKFAHTGKYVTLHTCNRHHRRSGYFYIDPAELSEWLEHGEGEHFQRDCGYMMFVTHHEGTLRIKLLWHHHTSDSFQTFLKQEVIIPMDIITSALAGNEVHYLHIDKEEKVNLDFSHAARSIQEACKNKQKRRALSKAMRNSFRWRGASVSFYPDTPAGSFFFRELHGICGGLILHSGTKKTAAGEFPYYEYSVHT